MWVLFLHMLLIGAIGQREGPEATLGLWLLTPLVMVLDAIAGVIANSYQYHSG